MRTCEIHYDSNVIFFNRFNECLRTALQPQEESSLQEVDKKPIYRRRRKRIQGSSETDCDSQSVKEKTESNQEEIDFDLMMLS